MNRNILIWLVACASAIISKADDRFFPVASKVQLSATLLGVPSVNEKGDVVLRLQTASERSLRLFLDEAQKAAIEGTLIPSETARTSTGTLNSFPGVNMGRSVLGYNLANGFQLIQRLDRNSANVYVSQAIARADPSQSPPDPFSFVSPIAAISENNKVFFYAERTPLNSSTLLKAIYGSNIEVTNPANTTPIASTDAGYNTIDSYVAASSDGTYITWRGSTAGSTGIYTNAASSATSVDGFTNTGARPSINSDGVLACFASFQGSEGIYLRGVDGITRRAGDLSSSPALALTPSGILPSGYTGSSTSRVALNDFAQTSFVAVDNNLHNALYTTALGRCRPLLAVGDTFNIGSISYSVASVALFDALKKNGQSCFWVSTTDGQEFILRSHRAFTQTTLNDSPIQPSYKGQKYLLRSIPAEETRLNAANPPGPSSALLSDLGCNLTTTANILYAYGLNVSPGQLQTWLLQRWQAPPSGRKRSDYINSAQNDFVEQAVQHFSAEYRVDHPDRPILRENGPHTAGAITNLQRIVQEIRQGYPVKLRVPNGNYTRNGRFKPYDAFGHYILAYGLSNPSKPDPLTVADVLIHDPGNGGNYTLKDFGDKLPSLGNASQKYNVSHPGWLEDMAKPRVITYRPLVGDGLPSGAVPNSGTWTLSISPIIVPRPQRAVEATAGVGYVLTDDQGRRLGIAGDGTAFEEIPGGRFFSEAPYTGLDGEAGEDVDAWEGYQDVYRIDFTSLPQGNLTLTISTVSDIRFDLAASLTGDAGGSVADNGVLMGGSTRSYAVVTNSVTPILQIRRIDASTWGVSVASVLGKSYLLEESSALSDWSALGGPRAGTGTVIEFPVPTSTKSFYRVKITTS